MTSQQTFDACPVSWCERSGKQRFEDEFIPDVEHTRACTNPETTITGYVAAEVFTRADSTISDPVLIVDLDDTSHESRSAYDTAVLVNSIIRAAETAWPGFRKNYRLGWPA